MTFQCDLRCVSAPFFFSFFFLVTLLRDISLKSSIWLPLIRYSFNKSTTSSDFHQKNIKFKMTTDKNCFFFPRITSVTMAMGTSSNSYENPLKWQKKKKKLVARPSQAYTNGKLCMNVRIDTNLMQAILRRKKRWYNIEAISLSLSLPLFFFFISFRCDTFFFLFVCVSSRITRNNKLRKSYANVSIRFKFSYARSALVLLHSALASDRHRRRQYIFQFPLFRLTEFYILWLSRFQILIGHTFWCAHNAHTHNRSPHAQRNIDGWN